MSYVLDVLSETKWDQYLYHATDHEFNPKEIKAGSHLGTLHAAMTRGIGHLSGGDTRLVHVYKYKSKGKSVEVEDDNFGDPESDADKIAGQLSRYGNQHISDRDYKTVRRAPEGKKVAALGSALKKNGISSLHYKNKFEDKESTSHIIFDPENLHHVHTFNNPKYIHRKGAYDRFYQDSMA
jgi:hypothetical protein